MEKRHLRSLISSSPWFDSRSRNQLTKGNSMPQYISRGTLIDTQKCVEQSGGNRFNLVIMAAARAREIRRQHSSSQKFEHVHTTVSALLDFQDGTLNGDYMKKVRFDTPRDRAIDRQAKYNR